MTNSNSNFWNDARLNRLAEIVQDNATAIANQQQQMDLVATAVDQLAGTVLQLAQKVDTQVSVMEQQLMEMRAESERQGRILDFLVRQLPPEN